MPIEVGNGNHRSNAHTLCASVDHVRCQSNLMRTMYAVHIITCDDRSEMSSAHITISEDVVVVHSTARCVTLISPQSLENKIGLETNNWECYRMASEKRRIAVLFMNSAHNNKTTNQCSFAQHDWFGYDRLALTKRSICSVAARIQNSNNHKLIISQSASCRLFLPIEYSPSPAQNNG